jgi:hypothetical protein
MIAHPHRLPHVVWQNSRLVPLSEDWLIESIEHSARTAGYASCEVASHLARAVALYLEEHCKTPTLTVDILHRLMQTSLEGVGYYEVAAASVILPPRLAIFLPELATRAPYELIFFPALGARLREALACQVSGLRLEGLRDCSKILHATRKWRESCLNLSEQIISYSRACIAQSSAPEVDLVIS